MTGLCWCIIVFLDLITLEFYSTIKNQIFGRCIIMSLFRFWIYLLYMSMYVYSSLFLHVHICYAFVLSRFVFLLIITCHIYVCNERIVCMELYNAHVRTIQTNSLETPEQQKTLSYQHKLNTLNDNFICTSIDTHTDTECCCDY